MGATRALWPALAAMGIAASLAAAGCGGGSSGSSASASAGGASVSGGAGSAQGKEIFTANCSGCHTLADAGATGSVGPNLDELQPDLARVKKQVINGGTIMPAFKGKLTDAQITAVAKYVAAHAGKK